MTDQAEGLRRLLGRDFVRIITLTSSKEGVGKTTAVLNLAVALAKAGKNVLVLDENPGRDNLAAMLGIENASDLLDVAGCGKTLEEAMICGPEGISLLCASQGVQALSRLGESERGRLVESMSHIARPADVVLVDTAAGSPSHLLSLSLPAQEIVVVLSAESHSITEAYGLIKGMNLQYGKRHFRILVNKVRNEEEAHAVFGNMSKVARRFLAISLEFMGYVPLDESLRQASRIQRPAIDAFPLCPASLRFRQHADSVLRWPCPQHSDMSLGDFLQHLMQGSRLSAANI